MATKNYEMEKVTIKKTPNGDIRTIEVLDKELVYQDTMNHIIGVKDVMKSFSEAIIKRSEIHDYTKIGYYYDQFFEALQNGLANKEFGEEPWYDLHVTTERHHLIDKYPDDVNLIDIIEMLCDCVAAGKARSGEVYPIKLKSEMLQLAVENTVKLLTENVEAEK